MITIGITGGIGSGKTTVCRMFQVLGVKVFDADAESKKLLDTQEILARLVNEYPSEFLAPDEEPDMKKIASYIFKNKEVLKSVVARVQPLVKEKFKEWKMLHSREKYVIIEAAVLFESGAYKGCDKVITITASPDLRTIRVMERDGRTWEDVEVIMRIQWKDDERIKRSDFVIVNDGVQMLIPQVLKIHEAILKLAESQAGG